VRNTDTDPSTAWANSTPFNWGFQSWTGFSFREFGVLDLPLTEACNAVYHCHIPSIMWLIASVCVFTVYNTILDATHLKAIVEKKNFTFSSTPFLDCDSATLVLKKTVSSRVHNKLIKYNIWLHYSHRMHARTHVSVHAHTDGRTGRKHNAAATHATGYWKHKNFMLIDS